MPMTGTEMREVRLAARLTQAELAEHVGLSRKSINEAEALGPRAVDRRTEMAVRALTLAAAARRDLVLEARRLREAGDDEEAQLLDGAATLLTGGYATDERTLYNLARTAATYRREAERLRSMAGRRRVEPLAPDAKDELGRGTGVR
ncbi:MAG TPA: hypothetical protein VF695_02065 [Sphingomonas sp.]